MKFYQDTRITSDPCEQRLRQLQSQQPLRYLTSSVHRPCEVPMDNCVGTSARSFCMSGAQVETYNNSLIPKLSTDNRVDQRRINTELVNASVFKAKNVPACRVDTDSLMRGTNGRSRTSFPRVCPGYREMEYWKASVPCDMQAPIASGPHFVPASSRVQHRRKCEADHHQGK